MPLTEERQRRRQSTLARPDPIPSGPACGEPTEPGGEECRSLIPGGFGSGSGSPLPTMAGWLPWADPWVCPSDIRWGEHPTGCRSTALARAGTKLAVTGSPPGAHQRSGADAIIGRYGE